MAAFGTKQPFANIYYRNLFSKITKRFELKSADKKTKIGK